MKMDGVRRFFRLPLSDATVASEVADEVSFHIESRVEELMRAGLDADAARRLALSEFGDVNDARTELTRIDYQRLERRRRGDFLDSVRHDMRLIMRTMFREPWFVIAVVVTLGLGIGVNAAMFGITDRLLFRAPPGIVAPQYVKRIFYSRSVPCGSGDNCTHGAGYTSQRSTSWPDYEVLKQVNGFSSIAAYFNSDASLGRGSTASKVRLSLASASLFPTLGARPVIGRFYTESEDAAGRGAHVAVLGYAFWKKQFGGDRNVLGRTVLLSGKTSYTIIGVAPRGFNGAEYAPVDLYVPVTVGGLEMIGDEWNTPSVGWINVIARVRPNASLEQINAQATTLDARVSAITRDDKTARVTAESIILPKAPKEMFSSTVQTAQISLWLSGLSLLVLVIACANVVNLLLVRVQKRQRETGIRMALGVGRARLVRYFILETLTLALCGGLFGLLLAQWGGGVARRLLLPDMDWGRGALDARVLLYTLLLVLITTIVSALAPAIQSLSTNLNSVIKSGAREAGSRSRTRHLLIALQTALSVVMLVVAGLFVRSQINLRNMDKGFDADHVMAVYVNTDPLDLTPRDVDALYRAAAERVRHVPGVADAGVAMTVPFWSSMSASIKVDGLDSIPVSKDGGPYFNLVMPNYFHTMGTKIVRGRAFTENDVMSAPKVTIVSETMARKLWPHQDALGKCIHFRPGKGTNECTTVVGVAQDALRQTIEAEVLMMYLPLDQMKPTSFRTMLVRSTGDPARVQPAIRKAMLSIRSDMPYSDVRVLADLMSPQTRQWQLGAVLFSAFGILALFLAGIGLYSVIAYNVSQRTRELSVRMALGARAKHLVNLVVADAGRVVVFGLVVGIVGALFASRKTSTLLFHQKPWDGAVFGGVVVILLVVGIAAAFIPSLRAVHVAPNTALKEE